MQSDFLRQSDEILSVGEFSRRFKMLVKTQVPELWIRGEISNLKTYSSGHIYFTLKDSDASIQAVLFKGYSRMISFPLREGMKILAFGEVSVYEARGNYQLVIKAAMQDGAGELAKRFEQLKQKLSEEGLFDKSRKRQIPVLPQNIAVITSPTGAAIRDFCRILIRRHWRGNIFILPARVQGAESAPEIVKQIHYAQKSKYKFDLLILMRGGGSLEDLWSFNDEFLARAVAASVIPTISAVGHEIDFTLSDFSADLRAETPSAAAEYISSNFIEVENTLLRNYELIKRAVDFKVSSVQASLRRAEDVLRLNSPSVRLENANMRVDDMEGRLHTMLERFVPDRKNALNHLELKLKSSPCIAKTAVLREKIDACQKRLQSLDINNVLARGFSIIKDDTGKIVSSSKALKAGTQISVVLTDGERSAKVL